MIAACNHSERTKHGKDRLGNQRYKCKSCRTTFVSDETRPLGDMRIDLDKAVVALNLLLEGMSVRATSRMTGMKIGTICDLILHVGENCQRYLDTKIQGVKVEDVEVDEIWSFVGCKNRTAADKGYNEDSGDSWTAVAIERNTKLVIAHQVGERDNTTICILLQKLADNTVGRFQLSSDGLASYKLNVPYMLRDRVDFGIIIKQYQSTQKSGRYSPAAIIGIKKRSEFGRPDRDRIGTSIVERFNLTMRMQNRRFTRLTNAHSKSRKHHAAMQAIFVMWYNYARKHETIKQTPAMASGLAEKKWSVKDLVLQVAN
ncbi:IS1 family transposase [Bythopirellula goksoeyrii]|uniref:IS1 transposase n=1 Tax=Bythopirellula goksoeyrii TaxID=1400387 RepID=A0A5B9QLA6_9BACT|nr:IS1 family transposase [Bythopirellula goksoeyrii]QEG34863.1 IS1 transposase [Bythopirellula goksoeyrii]